MDGIRAFAALYVVFHHASQELLYRASTLAAPSQWFLFLRPLDFGHYAVDVFIVLSGYCLMLPAARTTTADLGGGVTGYLRRRARRILPPFYAAFLISIAIVSLRILLFPSPGGMKIEALMTPRIWLAHLFVVQNVVPGTCSVVDAPLWSVATEWQIYFVFPLLLLPIFRRWGATTTVVAGLAIGMAIYTVFPHQTHMASPWYIGLFAMGMAAAVLTVRADSKAYAFSQTFPWTPVMATLVVGFLAMGVGAKGWLQSHRWVADIIVGLASLCLLQACVTAKAASRSSLMVAAFESRLAVALGAFSYSIYLIHYPLLQIAHTALISFNAPPLPRFAIMLLAVPLGIVGISYLFHIAFERPFMTRPRQAPANATPRPVLNEA